MASRALRAAGGFAVACTLLALMPTPAHALNFTVNSTADEVDKLPGDGVCATVRGACTLRAAVMEANATPVEDSIDLPAGKFKLKSSGAGDASIGDLNVTRDLRVRGLGAGRTTIDGGHKDRVFNLAPGIRLVVEDLTISGGKAYVRPEHVGGGIHSRGRLVLNGVTFSGNVALWGGGLYQEEGTLDLYKVRFLKNRATYDGGGAYLLGQDTLTAIDRVTFAGNAAGNLGGGLYSGRNALEFATFSGNRAKYGGGVAGDDELSVKNVTFSGNRATERGGGLYTYAGLHRESTLMNVTVYGNRARQGGGLYAEPANEVKLLNTLLVGNRAGTCGGIVTTLGGNLEDADDCVLRGVDDHWNVADPRVDSLRDNGGHTQTHALLQNSPAIDAGTGGAFCPPVDQRHELRSSDGDNDGIGECDIGAFEYQP